MSEWEDYESGPFCRHFSDPADCELKCVRCGHRCPQHDVTGDKLCMETNEDESGDCDCPGYKSTEEED